MYALAVDLRGFYLKVFQFIGARGDFVPEAICKRLSRLHDEVPPMPPGQVRAILQNEFGVQRLEDVFEWIDLERPLGSASLAQVHKARLVRPDSLACNVVRSRVGETAQYTMRAGETLGDVAQRHLMTAEQLAACNPGLDPESVRQGQTINLPLSPRGIPRDPRGVCSGLAACTARQNGAVNEDGVVAVKVQYPDASHEMSLDLGNIRAFAQFLSKTELQFDLASAVDELADQIRMEFFFRREASVMDAISGHLKGTQGRIRVPKSVKGLVTERALVMDFIDGIQITKLADKMKDRSERERRLASRRILSRVSEAYGRMLLNKGLFQADGHPGNILVLPGGRVGLIDYGQSKQLEEVHRRALAKLVLAIHGRDDEKIAEALHDMGVIINTMDTPLRAKMACDMFDTKGGIDPFSEDSSLKNAPISTFPKDMFFVLRTTQLLRGLANGMEISDFSCADQWAPYARKALRGLGHAPGVEPV